LLRVPRPENLKEYAPADLGRIVGLDRIYERWKQENLFEYMRQEFLIDALADYDVEPDHPTRSVSDPARKEVE
jgi:hypothetical protein